MKIVRNYRDYGRKMYRIIILPINFLFTESPLVKKIQVALRIRPIYQTQAGIPIASNRGICTSRGPFVLQKYAGRGRPLSPAVVFPIKMRRKVSRCDISSLIARVIYGDAFPRLGLEMRFN